MEHGPVQTNKPISIRGRRLGGGRAPLVCVPLTDSRRDELLAGMERVVALGPDLIEWRADFYDDIGERDGVADMCVELAGVAGDIPLILTIRSAREGGQPIPIGDAEVAALCAQACETRTLGLVDVEIGAPRATLERVRAAAEATGTGLILSFHDFAGTPDEEALFAKFAEARALGADVAKVAVTPLAADDVLVLLRATLRAYRELDLPLISMSMGPLGVLSRVAGWLFGSSVTFAAGESASAPGQIPVGDLRAALGVLHRALGER